MTQPIPFERHTEILGRVQGSRAPGGVETESLFQRVSLAYRQVETRWKLEGPR